MNSKPRLLDLFCGAGGAAMGYHKAGFEVVGVDINSQPRFPFEFHQADALTYPLDGFDAYHASPPCQAYSTSTNRQPKRKTQDCRLNHPDLIDPTRTLLCGTKKPFVIENVPAARGKLLSPFLLCGEMFGLTFFKHRLFESNILIPTILHTKHKGKVGDGQYVSPIGNTNKHIGLVAEWRKAMEIDWMTVQELSEAIPPAYTEYIGKYLMKAVKMNKIELIRALKNCGAFSANLPEEDITENFTWAELAGRLRYYICANCISYESEKGCERCSNQIIKE